MPTNRGRSQLRESGERIGVAVIFALPGSRAVAAKPTVRLRGFELLLEENTGRDRLRRHCRVTNITRIPCSWRQCVTTFAEELPWLKGRDLELVMGRAVWRLDRL